MTLSAGQALYLLGFAPYDAYIIQKNKLLHRLRVPDSGPPRRYFLHKVRRFAQDSTFIEKLSNAVFKATTRRCRARRKKRRS